MATVDIRTIFLDTWRGPGEEKNAAAGTTIKPGMLLRITSADEFNVHNVAGGNGIAWLAHEDGYQHSHPKGGVEQVYTAGEPVFAEVPPPGAKRAVRLKANENVVIGDALISDGTGLFIKTTGTPTRSYAIAVEASNVATEQLIKARFI